MSKQQRRKKILGSYPLFTVMISITLSLVVMGLFGLILLNAGSIKKLMQYKAGEIQIYLHQEVSDSLQQVFRQEIYSNAYIKRENDSIFIQYTSSEQAKKEYIALTGVDFTKVIDENPLPASYTIQLDEKFLQDTSNISFIAGEFKKSLAVREVTYEKDLMQKVLQKIKMISWVMAGFAAILILVTVLLIHNTIRLALYSQRFLIRSMQLVGARPFFIRKPFLYRAAFQGFLSGVIASGILFGLQQYAFHWLPELKMLYHFEWTLYLYASMIIAGILIGVLSAFGAVSKYLNMTLDDLY